MKPIVLLHGMLGGPENWEEVVYGLDEFPWDVHRPVLPIIYSPGQEYPKIKGIDDLTEFVAGKVKALGLKDIVIGGNSLGGQIAIDYTLKYPNKVSKLILAGSAGLFERKPEKTGKLSSDREIVKSLISEIFYDKSLCTEDMIDKAEGMFKDRKYARMLVSIAKITRDYNLKDRLKEIDVPTLLLWGRQDTITPPEVAEEFYSCIKKSVLFYINECGHAPPIERPEACIYAIRKFLDANI